MHTMLNSLLNTIICGISIYFLHIINIDPPTVSAQVLVNDTADTETFVLKLKSTPIRYGATGYDLNINLSLYV